MLRASYRFNLSESGNFGVELKGPLDFLLIKKIDNYIHDEFGDVHSTLVHIIDLYIY